MHWEIPGYTELRELGRGGFGRVVLARHDASGTVVAIKYLSTESAGDATDFLTRFRAEVQAMQRVVDPHVARLYAFVEVEQGAAIVMEAVPGVALSNVLDRSAPLSPEVALTVLKGSLLGLSAAHAMGVVHRDYKPPNVLVRDDGSSTLIDFGIAAPAGEPGVPAGSPSYMAPEQWSGNPSAPATDVYAATCVFYECVTGHRPYAGSDVATLRGAHLRTPVPLDEVPEAVRGLVAHGMAKDPRARPAGAGEFTRELEAVAVAAYGPAWEDTGLRRLAEVAGALAALAPIAVLLGGGAASLVSGASGGLVGAASGTAASGAASGTASGAAQAATGAAGKSLAAKVGGSAVGKAVVATAGAAVVGAGAFVVVKTIEDEPPPHYTLSTLHSAFATSADIGVEQAGSSTRIRTCYEKKTAPLVGAEFVVQHNRDKSPNTPAVTQFAATYQNVKAAAKAFASIRTAVTDCPPEHSSPRQEHGGGEFTPPHHDTWSTSRGRLSGWEHTRAVETDHYPEKYHLADGSHIIHSVRDYLRRGNAIYMFVYVESAHTDDPKGVTAPATDLVTSVLHQAGKG